MRDPEERAASLALRDGGPAPVRRAVDWYRTHDRLHCGDPIAMAADALTAYRADIAAGKDALLVCDTTEMADALNRRIHDDTIDRRGAPPSPAPVGTASPSGISSSPAATTPPSRCATPPTSSASRRSGAQRQPLARRRHRPEHQPDRRPPPRRPRRAPSSPATTSASTSPTATRSPCTPPKASPPTPPTPCSAKTPPAHMLYVAMTRGRDTNTAYLYQRTTEQEYGRDPLSGSHVLDRGTAQHAGRLARAIIANHDQPVTAHQVAAQTPSAALSQRVRRICGRRASTVRRRRATYQSWQADAQGFTRAMSTGGERHTSRSRDQSLDCEIDM